MKVKWAHASVVCATVVLGLIIPQVFLPGVVTNLEYLLCLVAQQPKISHVHRPRPLALDGVGDDAHRGGVVAVDRGWGLGMAHLLQGESHDFCFDGVEEEGAEFGLGRGRGDAFENGAICEDCTVEADGAAVLGEGAEEEVAARAAARLWGREVGGVAVDVEHHVGGVVTDFGVGVAGHVVEE